ncbi:hypothetical protein BKI52_33060 [marine bacterium AO1-C]|nr:hypothetical protein BKI52_33060 [marine bacterium AO1-C]
MKNNNSNTTTINDPKEAMRHFRENVLPTLEFDNPNEEKQVKAWASRSPNDLSNNQIIRFLEKYEDHCRITWRFTFKENEPNTQPNKESDSQ